MELIYIMIYYLNLHYVKVCEIMFQNGPYCLYTPLISAISLINFYTSVDADFL